MNLKKLLVLVGCIAPVVTGLQGAAQQPNILLFFTDDQRRSAVGAMGNREIHTPNLDRLAEEGMTFARAYMMGGMTGATCVPSRSMLHTGQHLFHLRNRGHAIRPDTPTLGETLRASGYHTYFSGKRHAMDRQTLRRSFESGGVVMGFAGYFTDKRRMPMHDWDPEAEYRPADGYVVTGDSGRLTIGEIKRRKLGAEQIEAGPFATELYVNPAVEFLRCYEEDRPFFAYVSLSAPHDPHEAPEAVRRRYDPEKMSLPENFLPQHPFDNGELDVRDEKLAARPRELAEIRQRMADYYASVTFLDRQFGRLISALEESGQRENTIVVFMGDSGLAVGQHGLLGKQNLYDDAGIGVPWIMSGPGIPGSGRSQSLVCTYDLYPTLCELLGIPVPKSVDGLSVVHLFDRSEEVHRPFVYAGYRDIQRAVVGPRYKLIEYVAQDRDNNGRLSTVGCRRTQLFDLRIDPWETSDLSEKPEFASILRRMRERMAILRNAYGDGTAASRDGYPDMHDLYALFWQRYVENGKRLDLR